MNAEKLVKQYNLMVNGPLVGYCNILSDDKVAMGLINENYKTNCNACHVPLDYCFSEILTTKKFENKIKKSEDISCMLFFDNFSQSKSDKENEADLKVMIKFMKAAHDANANVCLYSSRKEIPECIKKYVTVVKYGE
jgi:hypothetical protein